MKRIVAMISASLLASALSAQESIVLYDKVPGGKSASIKENSDTTKGIVRIKNVFQPTLTVYRPEPALANGTAVVICPGGGYSMLAASHEGSDVAKRLAGWGITAFVLKYRLPDDVIMTDKTIGPLQDAQRALQIVRQRAGDWNIDTARVGIMGFSAGGHLASTASTHFATPVIDAAGFSILIYPVISFTDSLMHKGSRDRLLGTDLSPARIQAYSNEQQVHADTPPAFLIHAADDKTVPVGNSVAYYQALIANKVPAEMHLYQNGGHGFGLNNKTTADQWPERLQNWLLANKWINKAK